MMTSSQSVTEVLDSVTPGEPNPTPIEKIPLSGCTYVWTVYPDLGTPYIVVCTREADHEGRQHVAEGVEDTGVLAVHPWEE